MLDIIYPAFIISNVYEPIHQYIDVGSGYMYWISKEKTFSTYRPTPAFDSILL